MVAPGRDDYGWAAGSPPGLRDTTSCSRLAHDRTTYRAQDDTERHQTTHAERFRSLLLRVRRSGAEMGFLLTLAHRRGHHSLRLARVGTIAILPRPASPARFVVCRTSSRN